MKTLFFATFILMFSTSFSFAEFAEEVVSEVSIFSEDEIISEEKVLETYNEDLYKTKGHTVDSIPSCNDEQLMKDIYQKTNDFYNNSSDSNDIDKRRQRLLLKKLGDFKEIPLEEMTPNVDFNLATKIIMTKINEKIPAEKMRLCKGSSSFNNKSLYILMYEGHSNVVIELLNFSSETFGINNILFKYKI